VLPRPLEFGLLGASVLVVTASVTRLLSRWSSRRPSIGAVLLMGLSTAVTVFALSRWYELASYMRLPADLLSFSESPFLNDIIKFRLGLPIYTDPQDNNSYPYTPGAPILTYLIASIFGVGDSIPGLRLVQFSYVVAAVIVAASVADQLARHLLPGLFERYRGLWFSVGAAGLFLVATDRQFNPYVHSLHNDGLALLVAMCGYWLMVRHAITGRVWTVIAMAIVPALGFLVKQNQLMWAGAFVLYFLASGRLPFRHLLLWAAGAAAAVGAAVLGCYLFAGGENFVWWVFVGLGSKEVSLARAILHLFEAGAFAMMGLLAGWVVITRADRPGAALWCAWLLVFALQVYTSGVAWVTNHLGPGVVIAFCWLLVALRRLWPEGDRLREGAQWPGWRGLGEQAAAAGIILLLFGALGLVRPPVNRLPADTTRYIAEIEREFQGHSSDRVLADLGTWIYARDGVVMKDRSGPVSLHVGENQPEMNLDALGSTIRRIEGRTYDKILARELDTDQSAYDFHDRGSGVKAAILTNYDIVRRIAAVRDVQEWWPRHMVAEVLVLEPKPRQ
jgi:hypothetical protein